MKLYQNFSQNYCWGRAAPEAGGEAGGESQATGSLRSRCQTSRESAGHQGIVVAVSFVFDVSRELKIIKASASLHI